MKRGAGAGKVFGARVGEELARGELRRRPHLGHALAVVRPPVVAVARQAGGGAFGQGPAHAPTFTVEVRVAGRDAARSKGPSKRAAEQGAAKAMLGALRKARDNG